MEISSNVSGNSSEMTNTMNQEGFSIPQSATETISSDQFEMEAEISSPEGDSSSDNKNKAENLNNALMKLQSQYDELLYRYEEELERSNSLYSSLHNQNVKLQSIEFQLKMVTDDLSKHCSSEQSELASSIQSLQSIIRSISKLDNESDCSSSDESFNSELSNSFEMIDESLDCLEKHVNENGVMIDSLKVVPSTVRNELDDLQSRLSVLFSTNILLNDVIDSNNQHTHELSLLLNEKSREICSLRNTEIDHQSQSLVISDISNQVQELKASLVQEQMRSASLENQLLRSEEEYKEQFEKTANEKKQEVEKWRDEYNSLSQSYKTLTEENTAIKNHNSENDSGLQKRLQDAESMIMLLRQQLQKKSKELLFSTTVGQFSTANPTAIIACIESLVARVSLAEAKMESSERRSKDALCKSKENGLMDSTTRTTRIDETAVGKIERMRNQMKKYRENEKTYKRIIFNMKEVIRTKEMQLSSIYSMINRMNHNSVPV